MALRDLICDESGQGLLEYGLILGLVSIAAIVALLALAPRVEGMYNAANEELLKVPG